MADYPYPYFTDLRIAIVIAMVLAVLFAASWIAHCRSVLPPQEPLLPPDPLGKRRH
ncbi:hypothetical protein [Burkholderia sp. WAC0059]|uniref:hypothetical protein n=1 Tax=Burkholderia sp. WAC0059 TaxID=2066022 RepID=UPI0015E0CBD7|nr:hypothetical protein [Burkholderia sp. WAC0059]